MIAKLVVFSDDARKKLIDGVNVVNDAVGCTLGPKGRLVLIDKGTMHPVITKDGVTVAREIGFNDKWKNLGAQIVKESAIKTNIQAGDGTTTATVLAANFAKEGVRYVSMGFDPNEMKKGMELAKESTLEMLEKVKAKISTPEEIFDVAMISANNDASIGEVIRDAFEGIGEYGIVSINNSLDDKTHLKFSSGLEMEKGYISSVFANSKGDACDFENPRILICSNDFSNIDDLYSIVQGTGDRPLVVLAPDFGDAVQDFVINSCARGKMKAALVKLAGFSKQSIEDCANDLAIMLNAKVLYKDVKPDEWNYKTDFGECDAIHITPTTTTFIGARYKQDVLDAYCADLSKRLIDSNDAETPLSQGQKDAIKTRLAKMTGGVATISIGAPTEIELIEKKHRFEDSVNAVRAAISDGIVIGGGSALAKVQKYLDDNAGKIIPADCTESFRMGFSIVRGSLTAPLRKILTNAGKSPDLIVEKVKEESSLIGYNARTNKMENLIASGVIDPVKVTRCALTNAVSVASMLMSTECAITNDTNNISLIANDPVLEEMDMRG
jgi:chaperonin GroEL